MKSITHPNQNKIHSIFLMLIGMMTLIPQQMNSFCCPTDHSSCFVNRYANTQDIELPAPNVDPNDPNQQGNPSPSQILVNTIPRCHVIKGLEVTLNIAYSAANRLSVALLSPCGDCIILLNEVGEVGANFGTDSVPGTVVFSDCKGASIPCDIAEDIVAGNSTITVKPTDCAPGNHCFNGTLDTTFCTTLLSKTFGKPANGCWQLFTCVKPGAFDAAGKISSWKLKIIHELRAQNGCFDVFTSTCCVPCVC